MEAGAVKPHRVRVPLPAGMNEAWRIFCRPGTKFCGLYECRGISFDGVQVKNQGAQSFIGSTGAIAV